MHTVGHIAEIWRYPVKSMAGERLARAFVARSGLPGDRAWAVRDEAAGEIRGGKKLPALMQCAARFVEHPHDGAIPDVEITLPDGRTIRSRQPDTDGVLSEALARAVTLWPLQPASNRAHYRMGKGFKLRDYRQILGLKAGEPFPDVSPMSIRMLSELAMHVTPPGTYFDAFPLHVLTTASLDAMAATEPSATFDARRFRPNLLVETVEGTEGLAEFDWCGGCLEAGELRVRVEIRTVRCSMPARAQPGLARDPAVMQAVARHADRHLGVYATVDRPGLVQVGDPVRFVPASISRPRALARHLHAGVKRGLFQVLSRLIMNP